ncbi:MAG: glycosyltransferase family 2 protein [Vulcanimicrobiaceae bacterium]
MPEISVVIPTYNRLDTLRHVIPTLLAQDMPAEQFELLVCDSQSSDGTAEYLAAVHAEHPNVRHLPGPYTGRADARNAGIRNASGEVVLFNDADILASPDLLSQHLRHHHAQTSIAVVGWEVQVRDLDDYAYKRDHPQERGSLHPPARKTLSWLYFLTGNASVRREDLLRVGCFDESFTGYGHEDLELGYRLQHAGLRILYEPHAVNYHCQDVPHDDQKEKMKLAGRSTVRFYRKHPHFDVQLNLGMTPLSLGLHSMLTEMPWLLGYFDQRARESKFARDLVQQYYYVSGIKNALAEKTT